MSKHLPSAAEIAEGLFNEVSLRDHEQFAIAKAQSICVLRALEKKVKIRLIKAGYLDRFDMDYIESVGEDMPSSFMKTEDRIDRHEAFKAVVPFEANDDEIALLSERLRLCRGESSQRNPTLDAIEALSDPIGMHVANLIIKERKKMWKILRCTVHPRVRRMGIGSYLIRRTQDEMRTRPHVRAKEMIVELDEQNEAALSMLRKNGFQEGGMGNQYGRIVMKWFR